MIIFHFAIKQRKLGYSLFYKNIALWTLWFLRNVVSVQFRHTNIFSTDDNTFFCWFKKTLIFLHNNFCMKHDYWGFEAGLKMKLILKSKFSRQFTKPTFCTTALNDVFVRNELVFEIMSLSDDTAIHPPKSGGSRKKNHVSRVRIKHRVWYGRLKRCLHCE